MASREVVSPERIALFRSSSSRCFSVGSVTSPSSGFARSRLPEAGAQLLPAEEVEMQMVDCLSGIGTIVGDHAIPTIVEPLLIGHVRREEKRVGEDRRIIV